MSERYQASEQMLERALRVIPLGSQTFSKSITQYPRGAAPLFIERGQGSRVWDVDGNEYIDFVNALCCVTLGYRDPDVDAAVREQMDAGVSFPLPHPLEVEVAERIVDMVPCAEQVRFGKNGSDATSAAIRLARARTGRDRVAACGYHGWHDWYIGTTARNDGVPKAVSALTHVFPYNDPDALAVLLESNPGEFAAVIMEPMSAVEPASGYLESVRRIAHDHGALLIFDETITGFRFANGGAQELFGVTPDMATFGKGLANGYPLSAVTGPERIMRGMEDIFFSGTFGGETLSLAAARAVLDKFRAEPVIADLRELGEYLVAQVNALIAEKELDDVFSLSGHPAWSFLHVQDANGCPAMEIRTLFLQEMFARGILVLGSHNLSHAHDIDDVRRLVETYSKVLPWVADCARSGRVRGELQCEPLRPLFRVRG